MKDTITAEAMAALSSRQTHLFCVSDVSLTDMLLVFAPDATIARRFAWEMGVAPSPEEVIVTDRTKMALREENPWSVFTEKAIANHAFGLGIFYIRGAYGAPVGWHVHRSPHNKEASVSIFTVPEAEQMGQVAVEMWERLSKEAPPMWDVHATIH